ncbi:methylenetetrahydrofolate reductase [Reichenbachiella versicolor]|uniref:methylenetetrahydrofolate reductase n=1 Tax=Reichenbachiella versicolor TaxID=1821036 RepID=UPI000D6E16B1|nr:methylenetetrahydrofolate reductase [Reichenbachiella versicolor]
MSLLDCDEYFVSAELTPPRHYDLADFMRKAEIIHEYVDVVQINDHLLSKARINNIIPGQQCHLSEMEVVLQFSLIHKNKIAIQGDLLAMAASGLENLIILGGYPCAIGSDPDATEVHDLDAIEAIKKIKNLTDSGEMFNGEIISPPPTFNIGAIDFACHGPHLSKGVDRLERKIDAGVDFIQLQAIFELESVNEWMNEVVRRGLEKRVKFIGAIFPFENAERLHALTQIPGLDIPQDLITRLEKNNCQKESLRITKELVAGVRQIEPISGLHIRSIGAEEWVPKIIEHCGLRGEVVY